jgi:hypothetical protein
LAGAEDIKTVLRHLTAAVQESRLLNQWPVPGRKAAVLEAISSATGVSRPATRAEPFLRSAGGLGIRDGDESKLVAR